MTFFFVLFFLLAAQRLIELVIAKKNEKWILQQGGMEFGRNHYPLMILLHSSFFISLFVESHLKGYPLSSQWPLLLFFLVLTQGLRYWAITSLGPFWNTRIMVLPGAAPIEKGPYRYLRHPNYLAVILEFLLIPLLFNAFFTCILFSLFNAFLLKYRISVEEKILIDTMDYQMRMSKKRRFLPIFLEKSHND
jgi:methyltransferase